MEDEVLMEVDGTIRKSCLAFHEHASASFTRIDQMYKTVCGNGDPKSGLAWKVEQALEWQKRKDNVENRRMTVIASVGAGMLIALVCLVFYAGGVAHDVEAQGKIVQRTAGQPSSSWPVSRP